MRLSRTATAAAIVLALALGAGAAVLGHGTDTPAQGSAPAAHTAASSLPALHAPARVPTAASLAAPLAGAKYLGVALPGGPAALPAFQRATGTSAGLYELYTDFGQPFPAVQASEAGAQGAYTLIAWQTEHVSLASIAAGADDAYLVGFAQAVKTYDWPVMIDFDHEFNGNWYPWGTQSTTAAQFVAAWRHIHDLFAANGATNIAWVWSPNVVNPVPKVSLSAYWPGAQFVDVVGIVGYYTGQLAEDSYAHLFGRTEQVIDTFADKPFLITETGAEQGPDKAAWISNLFAGVRSDPRMLGLVYFDYGTAQHKREDWALEDAPAALAAWRAGAGAIANQITVATS